jgi:hypothetical protein
MYYEIGDIANTGTPKAGVFAEGGAGRIGRVDVDFFSGPTPRTRTILGRTAAPAGSASDGRRPRAPGPH